MLQKDILVLQNKQVYSSKLNLIKLISIKFSNQLFQVQMYLNL